MFGIKPIEKIYRVIVLFENRTLDVKLFHHMKGVNLYLKSLKESGKVKDYAVHEYDFASEVRL